MAYFCLSLYVLCVLLANIFLDAFIPLPFFGLLSIGTIFFAFIFTLRDYLHRFGLNYVYCGIGMALLVTISYSLLYGIEKRLIFASFFSILSSELADTFVFERLKQRTWAVKVLTSNAISVPLDSILFTCLAFLGVMSTHEIMQIIFADIVVKFSMAGLLLILPYQWFRSRRRTMEIA